MLERSGLSKAIVSLATQATQFCEKEHLPLLYSLAFKHAVEAGDYDMAYKALSSNPCPSQKHACLKRWGCYFSRDITYCGSFIFIIVI